MAASRKDGSAGARTSGVTSSYTCMSASPTTSSPAQSRIAVYDAVGRETEIEIQDVSNG